MAKIKPFKAIRPTRDKVSLVTSRSYLSYDKETLIEKLEHNPYTFLHIINPGYSENKKKLLARKKYSVVKKKVKRIFCNKGILKKDEKAMLYLYQQQKKI